MLLDITLPRQTLHVGREHLKIGNVTWKKREPACMMSATAAPFMQWLIGVLLLQKVYIPQCVTWQKQFTPRSDLAFGISICM